MYWSSKGTGKYQKKTKLDPLNQLFLVLMKLRRNLHVKDLAYRFGISCTSVSQYFITWICFQFHRLKKEVDTFTSQDQVAKTLPTAFKEKYDTTFIIIDANKIYMYLETPSDMCLQSSTRSNYKHHNTGKILIGTTPNGCICFVSDVYMGSISDVKLTQVSGLFNKLQGCTGISVMADRGFTIKDQLAAFELNIPPFFEQRQQLTPAEVQDGRKIVSLHIHVERAIGRLKTLRILDALLQIRILNQIVFVSAWLTNTDSVLVSPAHLHVYVP